MDQNKLQIVESKGNLFDAPPNTLLVHACNCQGSWSAGIAKEFEQKYPHAYNEYSYICNKYKNSILGTAYMILPTKIVNYTNSESKGDIWSNSDSHFIGCLFTSYYYGKLKGSESEILDKTKSSITDLLDQVTKWNKLDYGYAKVNEVRMCKINAGLFGIDWRKTKRILESIDVQNYSIKSIRIIIL